MKRWRILLTLMVVLALTAISVGLFSACSEKTYVVVYNTMGGDALPDSTYDPNDETFYLPTPRPGDMYGFKFVGWYYDEACTNENKVVRESEDSPLLDVSRAKDGVITLYAAWSDVYTISFDSRTGEVFENVQYHFMEVVQTASLPVPKDYEKGGVVCNFLYWVDMSSGAPLREETFVMDSMDMFLRAQYDTGVDDLFDLTDNGYVTNLQSGQVATTAWSRGELNDGEALSVAVTFPADYTDFDQDCGIVFSATGYSESANAFTNAIFLYITSVANNNLNSLGGLQFWGSKTLDSVNTEYVELKRYGITGAELSDTPYAQKIAKYKASGEEETFIYTIRRCGSKWYVGVDGVEYVSIAVGDSAVSGGTISEKFSGSIVGLRAKCTQVYFSDLKIVDAADVEITFDAGEQASLSQSESVRKVEYGESVGTLPVPVHDSGWVFVGWAYEHDGATAMLSDTDSFDSTVWKIRCSAVWDDPSAKHYDIEYDTGIDSYRFSSVSDWFSGKVLSFPVLSSYGFYTFDGNWYYDQQCTQIADDAAFDPVKADVGEDGKTITLYAKYETASFTNTGWQLTDGVYSGPGDTFVSAYSFGVGQTLSVDVTLLPYETKYSAVSIFFGSQDGTSTGFRLLMLGTAESNADIHGAIQLNGWKNGQLQFLDGYSIRRGAGVLSGSSYQTGFESYMTNGEPFTFTMGVIADGDCFHCTINGIIIFTYQATLQGTCIGFGNVTANTAGFSDINVTNNSAQIIFDAGDGALTGETQYTLPSGQTLGSLFAEGELPVPILDGYEFKGWYNGSIAASAEDVFSGTVQTVTLTAHWMVEDATIAVTFDANGGSVSETLRTISADEALTALPVPTRSGYTFVAWYYDHERVYEGYLFPVEVTQVTLGASWMKDEVWDGTVASGYAGGTGTQDDPYTIETGAQLAYLAQQVNAANSYAGVYFRLVNGIDLNNVAWTPIGNNNCPFKGYFDGADNKIDNVSAKISGQCSGLFGCIKDGAVVCNLMVNITASGLDFVGGIVGATDQLVHIRNCEVYGSISASNNYVGGIVGLLRVPDEATVENCKSYASVSGKNYAGGIVGCNRATVSNCRVSTDVTVNGAAVSSLPQAGASAQPGSIAGVNETFLPNIGTTTDCGLCDATGKPIV